MGSDPKRPSGLFDFMLPPSPPKDDTLAGLLGGLAPIPPGGEPPRQSYSLLDLARALFRLSSSVPTSNQQSVRLSRSVAAFSWQFPRLSCPLTATPQGRHPGSGAEEAASVLLVSLRGRPAFRDCPQCLEVHRPRE